MTEQTSTPYSNRIDILGELWIDYSGATMFEDFVSYNDLGLPLAYALSTEIVESTPKAEMFINETFDLLLATLEVEDTGWDSLTDIFLAAKIDPMA